MLATGFILAIVLARRWAGRNNIDKGRMIDFGILMVILGVIGAKILHVIADGHFWDYVHVCTDPSKVDWLIDEKECRILQGVWDSAKNVCHPVKKNCVAWISGNGFAYYGGFIAAASFSIWFIRRHKWPAGKVCDMAGWTIPLGLAWGRMGCLLAGCCFGAQTDSVLGIVFPKGSPASRSQWKDHLLDTYRHESLPVHPTQLYEAVGALIIAAIAYFVIRPRKQFDGQVFVVSMIMYAVVRFMLEFIRRDERGGLIGLSTSQLVAIGIVAACSYLWFFFKKRSKRILDEK